MIPYGFVSVVPRVVEAPRAKGIENNDEVMKNSDNHIAIFLSLLKILRGISNPFL